MSAEQAKRTRGTARSILITPLGKRILREVEAGTYKFAPRRGYTRPPATLNANKGKSK